MKSKSILIANFLSVTFLVLLSIATTIASSNELNLSSIMKIEQPSTQFWILSVLFGYAFNAVVGWATYILKKSGGALICAIFSLYNIIVSLVLSLILFGTPVIHYSLIIFVALYVVGFIIQRRYNEDEEF